MSKISASRRMLIMELIMPDAGTADYGGSMRRSAVVAVVLAAGVAAGCASDAVSPSVQTASPRPTMLATATATATANPDRTASPSPGPRLDATELVEAVSAEAIHAHLAALQAIADRSDGTRATGSPGYIASIRHVTEALLDAGYDPALETFTHEAVSGTNVLVERVGTTGDRLVVVGAHLDSVRDGPGINDNGSGVAVLLVLADALADLPAPEHTIRFAFWDAEEGGPIGSAAHVATLSGAERQRIVAYLNLDMVGSSNPVRFVYDEVGAASGSEVLTEAFAAAFEDAGVAWDPIDLEGDSDHGPFVAAGIPTGGVFSGGIEPVTADQAARHGATPGIPSDACSHRSCDTLDNVDAEVAAGMARIVAAVLGDLAAP
jgi:aminopeptidase S